MYLYVYIDCWSPWDGGEKEREREILCIYTCDVQNPFNVWRTWYCVYWCFFTFEDFKSWRPVGPRGFLFEARVKIDSSLVSKLILVKIFRTDGNFQSFFVIPSPPPKKTNSGLKRAVSLRHSEKRAKLSPEEAMWCKIWRSPGLPNRKKIGWLVVWNMNFMTFHICIGNYNITNIFHRGWNHQPDENWNAASKPRINQP